MRDNDFLVFTDGTWDGTSLQLNGAPLFADRLRIRLGVQRNALDQITGVSCDHFADLQEVLAEDGSLVQSAGRVGLLPGRVEVDISGKSLVIENRQIASDGGSVEVFATEHTDIFGNLIATEITEVETEGQVGLDANGFIVRYQNITGDLMDPIAKWLGDNRFYGDNLLSVVEEVVIDFDGPSDRWFVAISLFKGRLIGADSVTEFILGISDNNINPFTV